MNRTAGRCIYDTARGISRRQESSFTTAPGPATTIRLSVGDENPRELIRDFLATARPAIDADVPGFSAQFPDGAAVDSLVDETYLDVHRRHAQAQPRFTANEA